MISQFITGVIASYFVFQVGKIIYDYLSCPLRHLPGPTGADPMYGHFKHFVGDHYLGRIVSNADFR